MPSKKITAPIRQRSRYFLSGVFFIVIFTILVAAFRLLKLETIECTLDTAECPPAITTSLATLKNSQLIGIDHETMITSLLQNVPVSILSIRKRLPNTLVLKLLTQKPAYRLTTSTEEVVVGETGIVLDKTVPTEGFTVTSLLPLKDFLQDSRTIQPTYHSQLTALTQALTKSTVHFTTVTWVDKDTIILIMSTTQPKVLLSPNQAAAQLETLRLILNSTEYLAIKEPITEIDLRFKLPVLRTKQ